MQITGSVFAGPRQEGDFAWMLTRPENDGALFVFNDNESQFRAYRADPAGGAGCSPGGGNAVIRPYRCHQPPRAAGIPTGDGNGYARLDEHATAVIDEAVSVVADLIGTGRYERVFYSADATAPDLLGTGIFAVGDDVRRYVVARLQALGLG
jgi:hypothetical protein